MAPWLVSALCLLCFILPFPVSGATKVTNSAVISGDLPLAFEPNRGQADRAIDYVAHGNSYSVFLKSSETVLALRQPGGKIQSLRLTFSGGKPNATATGAATLPGRTNYIRGRNPQSWIQDIPQYARVHYRSIYPGIDVVYYGNQGRLEYDFLLDPHADPARIAISFRGASKLSIDGAGELHVAIAGGEVIQKRPFAYQVVNGKPVEVRVQYRILNADVIGFEIANYEKNRPLVIDPVLVYSTYLGGSRFDTATALAADTQGNVYVTGQTTSVDFPAINAAQPHMGSPSADFFIPDAFVTKINRDGTALLFSTFLGGSGEDYSYDAAVDATGSVYVTGYTNSEDFPLLNAYQDHLASSGASDAFVLKLTASGTLVYSTYLGGSNSDGGTGIAVDVLKNVYVVGSTSSPDFVATTSLAPFPEAPNLFVAKLNASGNSLLYSLLVGGAGQSFPFDIEVDVLRRAYITGTTTARDFPITAGAAQSSAAGFGDVFVSKVADDGTSLIWSTYLGGTGLESFSNLTIDSSGDVYAIGQTTSADFPTRGPAFQTTHNGGFYDGFLSRFSATGTLIYSSYFGGSDSDWPRGVALDGAGNIHIAGLTQSPDFPTVRPMQPGIANTTYTDGFVLKFNNAATELLYSTYFGGSNSDEITGLDVFPSGTVYVAGVTSSTDLPTQNAMQPNLNGNTDAFVAKISDPGHGASIDRLLVSLRTGHIQAYTPAGALSFSLAGAADGAAKGMAFDSAGRLYVAHWAGSNSTKGNLVQVFNADLASHHVFRTNLDCNPTSVAFDSGGNLYVGLADCGGDVLKFNPAGARLASFNVAVDRHGAAWIDLATDDCTLFYGSEGPRVKRFNVCAGTQLPDFNPTPLPDSSGVFQVKVLPDGSVLAVTSDRIVRFDAIGAVMREFVVPGEVCLRGVAVDPSNSAFFVTNYCNSHILKFDLNAGTVLQSFTASTPGFTVKTIIVKRGSASAAGDSPLPSESAKCRFTGGGNLTGMTGPDLMSVTKVTHGFQVHCDAGDRPNNIEINWDRGNHFHLTTMLTAACTDNPGIFPEGPAAGCDTITGTGTGRYNGVEGATLEFMFSDAGEPGVNDGIMVRIKDVDGAVVLEASTTLTHGNHQAHD
jgi:hypothetical protein